MKLHPIRRHLSRLKHHFDSALEEMTEMDRFRFRVVGTALLLAVVIATGLTTTLAQETARPRCFGRPATVADHVGLIVGTAGNDVIVGDNGVNSVVGQAGHDLICGGGGNDQLFGDSGNDQIAGGTGEDAIGGGRGNDLIFGTQGDDFLVGDDGDDHLIGGQGVDILVGNGGSAVGVDVCRQERAASPVVPC
jgi:Ca2+-binding RTX toxin-like protein